LTDTTTLLFTRKIPVSIISGTGAATAVVIALAALYPAETLFSE
jgi:hypothetical protein